MAEIFRMEREIFHEKLYLFKEIARERGVFPWTVSYQTVRRYAVEGRVNLSGITVFLDSLKTPTGRATSREACRRFIHDLNT